MSQSIGEFLCVHQPKPFEAVDVISSQDFDIRQDAALRAFNLFMSQGQDIPSDQAFIDMLDDNEPVAKASLKYARLDALRAKSGNVPWRSEESRELARRVNHATLLSSMTTASNDNYCLEDVIDPEWEAEFDAIEDDWANEMDHVYVGATDCQREAIKLMTYVLNQKNQGLAVDSNSLRQRLKRLRKQTGWALNTRLL